MLPASLLRLASDERLVEQVRAGSERAFEALLDRHHRSVLAFCLQMLGAREEAEDAAQQTFLAAYRHLIGSKAPIALRPWLYTIARHRCVSVLRARRDRRFDDVPRRSTDSGGRGQHPRGPAGDGGRAGSAAAQACQAACGEGPRLASQRATWARAPDPHPVLGPHAGPSPASPGLHSNGNRPGRP